MLSPAYRTTPHALVLQSRLYSPGYAGPARWIIFNAATRRAFAALGGDVVPDVVSVLVGASKGAQTEDDLLQCAPRMLPEQLEVLVEAGLLRGAGHHLADTDYPRTLTAHYQRAVYDYPFHDYSLPGWQEEERAILDHYARLWPAPVSVLERDGACLLLPPASRSVFADVSKTSGPCLELLGTVLRYVFGPIGRIPTKYVECVRRTSPSGGARHPTEVAVVLPTGCGDLLPGAYLYDIVRHGLVTVESPCAEPYVNAASGDLNFILRSRVERAMWRYRDLRALRPVLLDAGHIAETLTWLLGRAGMTTQVAGPPLARGFSWTEEPEIATVSAWRDGLPTTSPRSFDPSNAADPHGDTDVEYLTNPAFAMTFHEGTLEGTVVWPTRRVVTLDLADFRALSHCLPSHRGDRATTMSGIREAVSGMTMARLAELVRARVLLPRETAVPLYKGVRLWSRHDWYLSFLTHLEAVSDADVDPSSLPDDIAYLERIDALFERTTTRAFRAQPLPAKTLVNLFCRVFPRAFDVPSLGFGVFAALHHVEGYAPGLYEWSDEALHGPRGFANPDLVQRLTTGQQPAGAGAVTIWVTRRLHVTKPGTYELELIDLGRVGQRLCLAATEMGLGVFVTPAVRDSETLEVLGIDAPAETATYVFGVGFPACGQPPSSGELASVSAKRFL